MTPLLLMIACTENGLFVRQTDPWAGEARIAVDPLAIDFLTLELSEERSRTVTLSSVGAGLLSIEGLEIEGDVGFRVEEEDLFVDLMPGESVAFEVFFSPTQPEDHEATLFVSSSDEQTPTTEVALAGRGLSPWLVVTPNPHDFGEAPLGCQSTRNLVAQNVGNAALELSAIDTLGNGDFTVLNGPELPLTLQPGAWADIEVAWVPGVTGINTGGQSFISNDPRPEYLAEQSGTGLATSEVEDRFPIDPNPPVDLIFAVDQSGSMDNDAEALAENFETLITTLEGVTSAWRIGVLTYDAGCFNNGVLKAWTPNLSTEFAEAVTAGEDREISDDEALFKILDRGLRQLDACNSGFRREEAPVHVIFVSDEPERSQEQAASWTYDYWLGEYNKVVPETLLTLSGVVDTEDCNEGDAGYSEAIAATGGLSMSICTTDWAQYAEDIALATLSNAWQFELSEQAASGSIQVQVDGTVSSQWSFNSGSNSVQMNGLQDASEVVISYSVQEECP